jgi:hypothetical protein
MVGNRNAGGVSASADFVRCAFDCKRLNSYFDMRHKLGRIAAYSSVMVWRTTPKQSRV